MGPRFGFWGLGFKLTGPKPKEIKVETFRIDYLIRTPKVEKLSLQPISKVKFRFRIWDLALRLYKGTRIEFPGPIEVLTAIELRGGHVIYIGLAFTGFRPINMRVVVKIRVPLWVLNIL